MINEGKLNFFEGFSVISMMILTKVFFTSIGRVIEYSGTSAWYCTIFSGITSMVFFMLLYLLMKRFPGQNLSQVFETVLGKFFACIIAILYCTYFVFYSGSTIREFIEMVKAYNLPYTMPSLIIISFSLAVYVISYLGLEGLGRLASIALISITIGIATIIFLGAPLYDYNNLFPIGGYGFRKTLEIGVLRASAYSEIVVLPFIMGSFYNLKQFKKTGILSLIFSAGIISIVILCTIVTFEYPQASANLSGLYELSRLIYYNRFIQRIEGVFLFIWVISSIVSVAAAFYISLSIYCKPFRIPDHRPLIIPFLLTAITVSLLPDSLSQLTYRNIKFMRQYSIFFLYTIPVIVLLLAIIRGKKGDTKLEAD